MTSHNLILVATFSEEIFGPVLTVITSDTLDDALDIINENKYGNGAVIFTQSGATARKFESGVNVGQVGFYYFMHCEVGILGHCFKIKGI
jgi:acyl-CoA reductase-like NAD-dependent aldehyde dehydrogenase